MTPEKQRHERSPINESMAVPYGMRVAGAWSWRIGALLIVSAMLVWLLAKVSILIIPIMIATILATLLRPVVRKLKQWRVPQGLSVAIAEGGLILLVIGALALVGRQMVVGFSDLSEQAITGLIQIQEWLTSGPLGLSNDQMTKYLNEALAALQNNTGAILSSALGVGTGLGHFTVGLLLTLFILLFFLLEGQDIWAFVVKFFPKRARPAIDGAARKGWTSLGNYARVQILVAAVDAIGIGAGAAIIQVPLALPLGVLVFVGSFIPVVGALVTGAVAVLLALVANGWVNALIMLAIVLGVQQLESHALQPFIMGRAVSLHPVAVILAVAAGSGVAGILGALFAVPMLAVANSFIRYIAARGWENDPDLPDIYGLPQVVPDGATAAAAAAGAAPGTVATGIGEAENTAEAGGTPASGAVPEPGKSEGAEGREPGPAVDH
ncbi:putative PurR-regulated permease PerM [Arthrobacter stackebrandtii]|uniref:PurR-regulated permease PerM n=1 Tax=Arthrobacter stackebrandtii TaxID=272161 RepID=A0ABS4YS65_9MICC|nr:AI-2E family transporter [Arthrobacter stackebrandtii]MBP2411646.1 putative PurR-regulated permease PerM [Arthrobacter stackebrandtii]